MSNQRKFLDHPWTLRLTSLFLSILLVAFVSVDLQGPRTKRTQNTTSVNVTENISNVPVYVSKAPEDMFVSNLPETVSLRITGPRTVVSQILAKDLYVVTEDLSEAEPGSRQIRLEMPEELMEEEIDYQINPSRIIVSLDRRETVEMPVEISFNYDMLIDGYNVAEMTLSQETVQITGKEKNIERISSVFVHIDPPRRVNESFTRTYNVEVRDDRGNLIDVIVEPLSLEATVVIEATQNGGSVKAKLVPMHQHAERFDYTFSWAGADEVMVSADEEILNQIEYVEVQLDLMDITTSGTYMATVQWPNGVEAIWPTTLPVYVEVVPIEVEEPTSVESQTMNESTSETSDEDESDVD